MTEIWRGKNPEGSIDQDIERLATAPTRTRRGVNPALPAQELSELPSGWGHFTVAQLLASGALVDIKDGNHGANHPKVSEFTDTGLPFITANRVSDGRIDYHGAQRVAGAALERLRVGFSEPRDVILTHKGSVGRVAVATEASVLSPQTTYYRCSEAIDPEYLAYFQESLLFYQQLAQRMSQTTRDFVPISDQYELTIVLPPVSEQREVVRIVAALLQLNSDVLERTRSALVMVDRSVASILGRVLQSDPLQAVAA